jgi:endonuclease/exonuclease/phosphatase (EEP) superfamily protein YafD
MFRLAVLILSQTLAWLLVVLACLPMVPSSQWWVRVWDFPRLQIALIGVVLLAALLCVWNPRVAWHWLTLLALGAVVVYESVRIFPYTPLANVQVAQADATETAAQDNVVSLLIINVLQYNRNASSLLALIEERDPDIVFAVETDDWWAEQLAAVAKSRPNEMTIAQDNEYGMVLYSRFPLRDPAVRELSQEGTPSIRTTVELPSGRSFVFFGLHPPPPMLGHADESTKRDAELVMVAREVEALAGPAIVAGDLNDVAWSHTSRLFQRISKLRDPRIGRGMYNSFHADYFFARWPLDHVFVSEQFRLIELERGPNVESDHFPMLMRLALTQADDAATDEPAPADADDHDEAQEILEEHAESPDHGG